MRAIILSFFTLGFFCVMPAAAQDSDELDPGIERHYCTQQGPFFLRFDPAKAAGVFAILANNDLGAVVGALAERTLNGEWIETDSKGSIRMVFSEDWSSFEAAYTIAPDGENWREGWTGYMPPAGDPTSFDIAGETFLCR